MQRTIQYLRTELNGLYPPSEVESMTRLVIEWVAGWDFSRQVFNKNELLPAEQSEKIKHVAKRLKNHEPLQYILGEITFFGLKLKVTPAVLIPRPETEELADLISKINLPSESRILDIGTGSGCIALALKSCFPQATVSAFDISEDALAVAKENSLRNMLDVDFFQADILNWNIREWPFFDVIVSNPPYVTVSEKKQMQRNVLDFEPESALFVDDDNPLLFYRTIAGFALKYLNSGGYLFFEINENFGRKALKMLSDMRFDELNLIKDLQGKNRMVAARKPF